MTRTQEKIDWKVAKSYYVTAPIKPTLNEMALKYKVSRASVGRHSSDEDWTEERERFQEEARQRAREKRLEQQAEDNLDALLVMEGQFVDLTEVNQKLFGEFQTRLENHDGRLESITNKDLLDSISKVTKAQDNTSRAINFLKGGADSRTEVKTFAELASMSAAKK